MAYLGNAPARSFISFERQVFTIVNSQTVYTLSHSVTNENDIRLVVNNVVQEPGSGKAYTASGTTLTLSAALVNGTDEMYCVFLGRAVGTVNAPAGSVGTSQLVDLNVTSGKIADDAVTLAKMAPGTDGNIISYDASGNPVAVATGTAGQILTSAGAGAPPTFATPAAAGKILKVQNRFNGALTASTATSSTHFDIVAGSMTFTPTSSSSNILCILSAGMDIVSNGGNCGWSLSLSLSQSGGLAVSNDTKTEYGYYSANQAFGGQTYGQNLSFIESYANSSTNAITITGQGHNYSEGNSQTVKFQRTSLIVMEWV